MDLNFGLFQQNRQQADIPPHRELFEVCYCSAAAQSSAKLPFMLLSEVTKTVAILFGLLRQNSFRPKIFTATQQKIASVCLSDSNQ
jgi:hypothetical protein